MAQHNIRFSQIVAAAQGRVDVKSYKTAVSNSLRRSAGLKNAVPVSKSKSSQNFIQQAREVMKSMGYNEAQIHHYLIKDDPKKAGITDQRTTERIIDHMRRQGVSIFKKTSGLNSASRYSRDLLDRAAELQASDKPKEKKPAASETNAGKENRGSSGTITSGPGKKSTLVSKSLNPLSPRERKTIAHEPYQLESEAAENNSTKPPSSTQIAPAAPSIGNINAVKDLPLD